MNTKKILSRTEARILNILIEGNTPLPSYSSGPLNADLDNEITHHSSTISASNMNVSSPERLSSLGQSSLMKFNSNDVDAHPISAVTSTRKKKKKWRLPLKERAMKMVRLVFAYKKRKPRPRHSDTVDELSESTSKLTAVLSPESKHLKNAISSPGKAEEGGAIHLRHQRMKSGQNIENDSLITKTNAVHRYKDKEKGKLVSSNKPNENLRGKVEKTMETLRETQKRKLQDIINGKFDGLGASIITKESAKYGLELLSQHQQIRESSAATSNPAAMITDIKNMISNNQVNSTNDLVKGPTFRIVKSSKLKKIAKKSNQVGEFVHNSNPNLVAASISHFGQKGPYTSLNNASSNMPHNIDASRDLVMVPMFAPSNEMNNSSTPFIDYRASMHDGQARFFNQHSTASHNFQSIQTPEMNHLANFQSSSGIIQPSRQHSQTNQLLNYQRIPGTGNAAGSDFFQGMTPIEFQTMRYNAAVQAARFSAMNNMSGFVNAPSFLPNQAYQSNPHIFPPNMYNQHAQSMFYPSGDHQSSSYPTAQPDMGIHTIGHGYHDPISGSWVHGDMNYVGASSGHIDSTLGSSNYGFDSFRHPSNTSVTGNMYSVHTPAPTVKQAAKKGVGKALKPPFPFKPLHK